MTPTTNTNWFTSTSTTPYDRHYYTVNERTFHDYEQMRAWWFEQGVKKGLTVNVMDYTTSKRTSTPQGF